jgi:hypothetical protein
MSFAKKLVAGFALAGGISALTYFGGNVSSVLAQENVAVPCDNPLLCNTEEVSQFKKVDACFLLLKKGDEGYEYPTAEEMEGRKGCKTISTQIREKWATFSRRIFNNQIFFEAGTRDVSFCQTTTGLWKATGVEREDCDKYGVPLINN